MYIIGRIDDLLVDRHRAILDGVEAENPDLRRIQDRRAHQRPEHAAVGDRERAALQIGERQRAVLGRLRELADLLLDLRERHAIGVAQHGHDEPFLRADGDADVEIVLQHHLVALDLGVDPRELAQRADRRP